MYLCVYSSCRQSGTRLADCSRSGTMATSKEAHPPTRWSRCLGIGSDTADGNLHNWLQYGWASKPLTSSIADNSNNNKTATSRKLCFHLVNQISLSFSLLNQNSLCRKLIKLSTSRNIVFSRYVHVRFGCGNNNRSRGSGKQQQIG